MVLGSVGCGMTSLYPIRATQKVADTAPTEETALSIKLYVPAMAPGIYFPLR